MYAASPGSTSAPNIACIRLAPVLPRRWLALNLSRSLGCQPTLTLLQFLRVDSALGADCPQHSPGTYGNFSAVPKPLGYFTRRQPMIGPAMLVQNTHAGTLASACNPPSRQINRKSVVIRQLLNESATSPQTRYQRKQLLHSASRLYLNGKLRQSEAKASAGHDHRPRIRRPKMATPGSHGNSFFQIARLSSQQNFGPPPGPCFTLVFPPCTRSPATIRHVYISPKRRAGAERF